MHSYSVLLFLTLFNASGIARPFGAPCEALVSMTPAAAAHGDPSVTEPPYVVEFLNPGSETEPECYRANRNYMSKLVSGPWNGPGTNPRPITFVSVRIRSIDGSSFSGFILQCRDINDNRFGTFLSGSGNSEQWQYQCRRSDSITHVRPNRKEQISVMWRPNGFAGEFHCK